MPPSLIRLVHINIICPLPSEYLTVWRVNISQPWEGAHSPHRPTGLATDRQTDRQSSIGAAHLVADPHGYGDHGEPAQSAHPASGAST
eukprot:3517986-Pyramimonas_sp.AAC.1